jgi:hypothetical protein
VFERIVRKQRDDLVGAGQAKVRAPIGRKSREVLPAPLGPMIKRRSPGRMESDTPCVTFKPPNDLFKAVISSASLDDGAVMTIASEIAR